jgi:hypothetical protein
MSSSQGKVLVVCQLQPRMLVYLPDTAQAAYKDTAQRRRLFLPLMMNSSMMLCKSDIEPPTPNLKRWLSPCYAVYLCRGIMILYIFRRDVPVL